jgi:hypothetical protein
LTVGVFSAAAHASWLRSSVCHGAIGGAVAAVFEDKRSDYSGEQECPQKSPGDWHDLFSIDDLNVDHSAFYIKTVEGDLRFLFVEPDFTQKPVAYYVYTLTWVR